MANSDDAAIDDGLRKLEDAAKRRYDAEKKWQDAIAENKKLAIDSEDAKIKGQQDEANKILETLGKAIADAKGVNGGNAIDEAKQGLDGWKVIKQVAKGRGDKAEQEAIDIENERDKSEAGKHGDSDKSTATRDAQRNARIRAARKAAEQSVFKDANQRKVGDSEINDAQSELVNSGIRQANATGKPGNATAQLGQEAVENSRATQNALAEQKKQVDDLRAQLAAAINGNAQRFRNQQGERSR